MRAGGGRGGGLTGDEGGWVKIGQGQGPAGGAEHAGGSAFRAASLQVHAARKVILQFTTRPLRGREEIDVSVRGQGLVDVLQQHLQLQHRRRHHLPSLALTFRRVLPEAVRARAGVAGVDGEREVLPFRDLRVVLEQVGVVVVVDAVVVLTRLRTFLPGAVLRDAARRHPEHEGHVDVVADGLHWVT